MKLHIGVAAAAFIALSSHASTESGTGTGSASTSSGLAGSLAGVLQFQAPSGFSVIQSPPPLIDYEGHYSQSLTLSLTPSDNGTYSFDFFYIAPTTSHVGLVWLDAWFEPALTGDSYVTVTAPSASIAVSPAFTLGGTVLNTAVLPIAPNMQTPVTVTLSDYRAGIAGACISGLSHCLYTSDPGTLKVKIDLSLAPVPEASTYALMGLGLVGIGLARRRLLSAR
ncbi:PEP-CTERM sorting domain-containing protein [Aquabacterium soli]|nr:PEP-CTERM sorting domain-containing protein [Aquabacterium soli]